MYVKFKVPSLIINCVMPINRKNIINKNMDLKNLKMLIFYQSSNIIWVYFQELISIYLYC